MKRTNGKVFFDTNILVYTHTDVDVIKQAIAHELIINSPSFISTQVVQELGNTLHRKFRHSWKDVEKVLAESITNNTVYINNEHTILGACRIVERYKFSFYDSLIISSALECECSILYSEDMGNNQVIERKLKITNPFL